MQTKVERVHYCTKVCTKYLQNHFKILKVVYPANLELSGNFLLYKHFSQSINKFPEFKHFFITCFLLKEFKEDTY